MGGAADIAILEVRLKKQKNCSATYSVRDVLSPPQGNSVMCCSTGRHFAFDKASLEQFCLLSIPAPQIVPYCEIELKKCDCELNGTCLSF